MSHLGINAVNQALNKKRNFVLAAHVIYSFFNSWRSLLQSISTFFNMIDILFNTSLGFFGFDVCKVEAKSVSFIRLAFRLSATSSTRSLIQGCATGAVPWIFYQSPD